MPKQEQIQARACTNTSTCRLACTTHVHRTWFSRTLFYCPRNEREIKYNILKWQLITETTITIQFKSQYNVNTIVPHIQTPADDISGLLRLSMSAEY
jgi:hypothetical protein